MKRTERHHLQEDQMAHGLSWLLDYAKKWKREVSIVAGALAFAALVLVALILVRSHNRSVQSGIIGQVGDAAAEAAQKPEKLAELEKLAGERRTARMANLELAKYWAERNDWAKAESYLGRISSAPKDLLYYQTEDIKAQVALGKKDFDTAIAIYQKISDEKPKVYPLDAVLFHLAESHELKGETKEALAIYKKVQEEYSQSYYGYEASLKTGRLALQK
ncbi:MAG: tetratricopeptide repeat protein [Candidatus Aminicenantes bacterium]|nr:MAG: tetratricopeptide repeat protein [Candidatus Aminicenantes bacterium]